MDRRDFLKTTAAAVGGSLAPTPEREATDETAHPEAALGDCIQREEIDVEVVGDATPIVVDPELLDIMEREAPFVPPLDTADDALMDMVEFDRDIDGGM